MIVIHCSASRILGHRDLPGVRKACPCYDVAKDLNGGESSQSLKTLPRIRGTPMHRGQKHASDSGHTYALGAETCLRFRGHLCTEGRDLTQIQGTLMHWVQKPDSDSRQTYARSAEIRLRFKGYLCPGCRNLTQIQGTLMPMVQRYEPDSRLIYARCAECSPRFEAGN